MICSRLFFLIVLFCLGIPSKGQNILREYKNLSDLILQKEFKNAVFKKIKCLGYILVGKKVGEGSGGDYYENRNKTIDHAEYTLIFYTLFYPSLNYKFNFHIVIDSNKVPSLPVDELRDIPECVKKGKKCGFISKQNAIDIAKKDSIQYPDNLMVGLKTPKGSTESYWVVSGQDKYYVDYSKPEPEDGWSVFPLRKNNTRYVNALTGKILKYEEYLLLDE